MGQGERLCPDCRATMREVSARARSGYLLALDQCGRCGGIWFDRWELFPLDHAEVAALDRVDQSNLISEQPARGHAGMCPRCAIALRPFRDPVLPPDARIERCFVCEGMWLQRGQLGRVKRPKDKGFGGGKPLDRAAIDGLLERFGKDARWSRVSDLDAATQTAEEPPPTAREVGESLWSAAPWLVLQLLMRFFLRR